MEGFLTQLRGSTATAATGERARNGLVRAIRHAEANDLVGRDVAAFATPPMGLEGRPSSR
jgi:hypothetical protein